MRIIDFRFDYNLRKRLRSIGGGLLIGVLLGCQADIPPTPIERIQRPGFRVFMQEMKGNVEQFSTSIELKSLAAGDSPTLSPDGKYIAFSAKGKTGGNHIWVMDVAGTQLTEVSTAGWDTAPQWSPDSKKIIFQSYGTKNFLDPRNWWGDTRQFSIWTVEIDGENLQQLIPRQAEFNDYSPSWSPDGKHVLWAREDSLWIADSQGQNARQLTTQADRNSSPAVWSADSQTVYADFIETQTPNSGFSEPSQDSTAECATKTWTAINIADSSKPQTVQRPFAPILKDQFSPFYYCVDQGRLLKVNPRNQVRQTLELSEPVSIEDAVISPDQKTLIFSLESKGKLYDSIFSLTIKEQ